MFFSLPPPKNKMVNQTRFTSSACVNTITRTQENQPTKKHMMSMWPSWLECSWQTGSCIFAGIIGRCYALASCHCKITHANTQIRVPLEGTCVNLRSSIQDALNAVQIEPYLLIILRELFSQDHFFIQSRTEFLQSLQTIFISTKIMNTITKSHYFATGNKALGIHHP